jgi:hypothetical protein
MQALKSIKQNPTVKVLKADKSNATYLCDTSEYLNKIQSQLSNADLYLPQAYDPTMQFQAKLKLFLKKLVSNNTITTQEAKSLILPQPFAPTVFPQVKLHKPGHPFRLITTSKYTPHLLLARKIKPCIKALSQCTYTCKNSSQFIQEYQLLPPPQPTRIFKADVVGLFPNISQHLMLTDLRTVCNENLPILQQFQLTTQTIIDIVKFLFDTTYVQFDNIFYLQINGTPMGGELSSFLTDISLNKFDHFMHLHAQFHFYKRFVDDIYNDVPSPQLDQILKLYNTYHRSLQFTFEYPQNNQIPFLDCLISIHPNQIHFQHYVKPTQTDRSIHFTTYTPPRIKLANLKNEVRRIFKTTPDPHLAQQLIHSLKSKYFFYGFPLRQIDQICTLKWAQTPSKPYLTPAYTLFAPYLGQISDQLTKIFRQYKIRYICTPTPNLQQHLTPPPPYPIAPTPSSYVYTLPCQQCDKAYIGCTSRGPTRLQEHLRDIQNKKTSSAPYQHNLQSGHLPLATLYKPLYLEEQKYSRYNLETLAIHINSDLIINLQIPDNYSIKKWAKFLKLHMPNVYKFHSRHFRQTIAPPTATPPTRHSQDGAAQLNVPRPPCNHPSS